MNKWWTCAKCKKMTGFSELYKGKGFCKDCFSDYRKHIKVLLQLVKRKGVLVEKMSKNDSFSDSIVVHGDKYEFYLGVVPVKGKFGRITHVYTVYQDHDGSIKYYDYIQ